VTLLTRRDFEVIVIGAGMGGLAAAQKLVHHGFTPTILEKADEVGGTWRDNRYPGLYVDIPVGLYQMLFAPKYDWSHAYAPGSEIQEYLVHIADDLGLRKYITFGVEVTSAEWTEGRWVLTTSTGVTYTADAVVAATGFLHRARLPRIEGMESFSGHWFHSSRWPDDLDVTGKRVAVVGSGSSGIQLVCALSEMDCRVVQYVRTPQWIETVDNPSASPLTRLVGRLSPRLGRRLTARLMAGIRQDPRLWDPGWKLEPGAKREAAQQALREDLEVIANPELRAALTPDFPPGCKRIPKSPWYYQAVQSPNVRVIRASVDNICAEGIVGPAGTVEPFDVIVYATGFDTHAYVRPMKVVGLDGASLDDMWGSDDVYSYRGVAVPNLPNFFILNGPFSPVNNVTIPRTLDDEMGWICELLCASVEESRALVPSADLTEEFVSWIAAAIPRTVWAEGCQNWYQGRGRIPVIWPWYDQEQTAMFRDARLDRLDRIPCRIDASIQPVYEAITATPPRLDSTEERDER
jgi:cation diffusion facilitator CzcD-associated flavoprotein CzcO